MAHAAYNCISVLDKAVVRIESIAAWGSDLLLIGSADGHLVVYEVMKKSEHRDQFEVMVVESLKLFGRKAITQLSVLSRSNLLLSLSDGTVSVHDIGFEGGPRMRPRKPIITIHTQLVKPKQAVVYAVDTTTPETRLCVATKKRLHFFRMLPGAKEFQDVGETQIVEAPKCLAWAGSRICVGYKKDYVLIDVDTGIPTTLFDTGKSGVPCIVVCPDKQLLLKKDARSGFVAFNGKMARTMGVSWSEVPQDMTCVHPYILGLLPSGIEVRTLATSVNVQNIFACKGASLLAVGEDHVYCASSSSVWRLEPVPILEQVQQLVEENTDFGEALNLLDCLPDSNEKSEQKHAINVRWAFHLFHLGQHDAALEKFLLLKEDPLYVLGLYPGMLPNGVIDKRRFKYPYSIGLNEAKVEGAFRALTAYLQKVRIEYAAKFKEQRQQQQQQLEKDGNNNNNNSNNSDVIPPDYHLCGDLSAVIIDTCLLRALLKLDHPFLADFVAQENYCHIPLSESALLNAKKFRELVQLYKVRKMHLKALELLAKLGKEGTIPDMKGVMPSALYLKDLTGADSNLVLEYSVWVLKENPELGLEIFTSNLKRRREEWIDPNVVLKHLNAICPGEAADYLERVIEAGDTDQGLHNKLIQTYLDSCKAILEHAGPSRPQPLKVSKEAGLLAQQRRKLLTFLETSQHYKAETVLSKFLQINDLYEERAILFSRIGRHDQALSIYVQKLEDPALAEAYCAKHFNDANGGSKMYVMLLSVYLQNPKTEDAALNLLNNHHQRFNTMDVIDMLPESIPVKKIEPFLCSVMEANDAALRENRLNKNLLRAEQLAVKVKWGAMRSKRVKITDAHCCVMCKRPFGKDAMFVLLPDSSICHYGCYVQQQQQQQQGGDSDNLGDSGGILPK